MPFYVPVGCWETAWNKWFRAEVLRIMVASWKAPKEEGLIRSVHGCLSARGDCVQVHGAFVLGCCSRTFPSTILKQISTTENDITLVRNTREMINFIITTPTNFPPRSSDTENDMTVITIECPTANGLTSFFFPPAHWVIAVINYTINSRKQCRLIPVHFINHASPKL